MDKALVLLHGSGDTAYIWHHQARHFATRAHAIDLPGHGQRADQAHAELAEVTVQDYAHAVHEIIQNELHLEHPIIAGHSLGGAIALMLALEHGAQLGGLILVGTGARLRVHPDLLAEARQAPEQAKVHLSELAVAPSHISTIARAAIAEQPPPAPGILYRDLAACNRFDVMTRLHEIQLPTLILCGEQDRLTPVKYSEYLHQQIAGSRLVIVPDAGHYVMWEQPEAVNQAIEEWA